MTALWRHYMRQRVSNEFADPFIRVVFFLCPVPNQNGGNTPCRCNRHPVMLLLNEPKEVAMRKAVLILIAAMAVSVGGVTFAEAKTKYVRAKFVAKAKLSSKPCPKGAIFAVTDHSCWKCPKGFKRSLDPNIQSKRACYKRT